ncbi:MAG: hypothetical protein DIZ79_17785 [endosymbiont of Lamellibrachia luymesi]|uniref:Uncharacterized protein n=1 Tax=endosymbiont of Lamellibrachia luymesi TaxID=2200907 RepID=A0A370DGX7_9GAMM|nr:MAG: hypothetical protein DIZ79_17785 [endosymbiont of Lamellibrachia luymesi]
MPNERVVLSTGVYVLIIIWSRLFQKKRKEGGGALTNDNDFVFGSHGTNWGNLGTVYLILLANCLG